MSDNILQIENVTKRFTGHTALDGVSFNVEKGKVYGLLGPNGAGKTTLIRIINHITAPDEGSVYFDGHRLTANDVYNIGYLPEERGLYKKMKVGEQALFFATLKGIPRREATMRLKEWFEKFGISDWWNRKVEELSKGMAQKVQFIVTVLHTPKLLIFDEPFSGFDPVNANLLKEEILNLRNQGATIIFSTHNMASVEEICDDITLINNGRNILTGNVAEIRREFSDGLYNFEVTDVNQELIVPLLGAVANDVIATPGDETLTLRLKLKSDAAIRDAVRIINENSTLESMGRASASMNDIFISCVSATDSVTN